MKKQFLKKHVAFIIAIMMFSLLPEFVAAQAGKKKCTFFCPNGYVCINGYCRRSMPFLTGGSPANESASVSSPISNALSFQQMQARNVSPEIYDAPGSLIKKLAYSWMPRATTK